MLLGQETGDGTSASSARDNALQGRCGQAANGAPSPVWGLKTLPTGCHPSSISTPLASLTSLPLKQDPLDPEAATRGFLAQGIEVTSLGHLYPLWVGRISRASLRSSARFLPSQCTQERNTTCNARDGDATVRSR